MRRFEEKNKKEQVNEKGGADVESGLTSRNGHPSPPASTASNLFRLLLRLALFFSLALLVASTIEKHHVWIFNSVLPHRWRPHLTCLRHNHRHPTREESAVRAYMRAFRPGMYGLGGDVEGVEEGLDWSEHAVSNTRNPHKLTALVEKIFLSVPNEESARNASRRYTAESHVAGTAQDRASALQVAFEWADALGASLGRHGDPEEVLYDAGSVEDQEALKGTYRRHDHEHGHRGSDSWRVRPKVWISQYWPYLNYPSGSSLTLHKEPSTPAVFSAKLEEDTLVEDPTSGKADPAQTFHGYSIAGIAHGPIVYAGYGRKSDFDKLERAGVNVTGAIALVRYGGVFRGLKVRAAYEAGAIGCLIYSDPGDDGGVTETRGHEAYPSGFARQPSSVQRGSVQALSKRPGDPGTPGLPAYKNATRQPIDEADSMPNIPSLPISYLDAKPFLVALKGHGKLASDIGKDWVGEVPGVEGYWTGPAAWAEFKNDVVTNVTPIWNTMARIDGLVKDEIVLLGNHRDAWTFGAGDPSSGTASLHEIVRGLGALLKRGWRPLRTIVIASWDAEEYGLVGSTEFGEDFEDYLRENAAVYLNTDVAANGRIFHSSASPSLADLIESAAKKVPHPDQPDEFVSPGVEGNMFSMWDSAVEKSQVDEERQVAARSEGLAGEPDGLWESAGTDVDVTQFPTGRIRPLGSGSDYTVFLQRIGLAASDMGFSQARGDPVYHYHSAYDSEYWMERYGDPTFKRHTAISKVQGLMTLRLADSLLIPLNVTNYAYTLTSYADQVASTAKSVGLRKDIHLGGLYGSIERVQEAAEAMDEEKDEAMRKLHHLFSKRCSSGTGIPSRGGWFSYGLPRLNTLKAILRQVRSINQRAIKFEQGFIHPDGIIEREWYRHLGVAPGRWLGYGSQVFPAAVEALVYERNVTTAQHEVDKLTALLHKMANALETP